MWNLLTQFLQVLTTASYHLWGERHRKKKKKSLSPQPKNPAILVFFVGGGCRIGSLTSYPGTPTFTGTHTRQHPWLWGARGHESPVVRWPHYGHYATTGQGGLTWHFNQPGCRHMLLDHNTVDSHSHTLPRDRRMAQFLLLFSIDAVDPKPLWARRRLVGQRLQEEVIIHLHIFHIDVFIWNMRPASGRRPPLTPLFRSWSAAKTGRKVRCQSRSSRSLLTGHPTRAGQAKRTCCHDRRRPGSLSTFCVAPERSKWG